MRWGWESRRRMLRRGSEEGERMLARRAVDDDAADGAVCGRAETKGSKEREQEQRRGEAVSGEKLLH
jgi:hypothetical protein